MKNDIPQAFYLIGRDRFRWEQGARTFPDLLTVMNIRLLEKDVKPLSTLAFRRPRAAAQGRMDSGESVGLRLPSLLSHLF
jgi:hypothetical protein